MRRLLAVPAPALLPWPAPPRESFRLPAADRIVAIGDLHGDLEATRAALRLGGAIDDQDHWIGGDLVVVQTGDQLDRGDQEQEILDLLDRLQQEAAASGGALHLLNGNHELMNARPDLRYVTEGGFADFAEFAPDSLAAPARLAAGRASGRTARPRGGVSTRWPLRPHAGPAASVSGRRPDGLRPRRHHARTPGIRAGDSWTARRASGWPDAASVPI